MARTKGRAAGGEGRVREDDGGWCGSATWSAEVEAGCAGLESPAHEDKLRCERSGGCGCAWLPARARPAPHLGVATQGTRPGPRAEDPAAAAGFLPEMHMSENLGDDYRISDRHQLVQLRSADRGAEQPPRRARSTPATSRTPPAAGPAWLRGCLTPNTAHQCVAKGSRHRRSGLRPLILPRMRRNAAHGPTPWLSGRRPLPRRVSPTDYEVKDFQNDATDRIGSSFLFSIKS